MISINSSYDSSELISCHLSSNNELMFTSSKTSETNEKISFKKWHQDIQEYGSIDDLQKAQEKLRELKDKTKSKNWIDRLYSQFYNLIRGNGFHSTSHLIRGQIDIGIQVLEIQLFVDTLCASVLAGHTEEHHIETCIESMTNKNREREAHLTANLESSLYGKENFLGISENEDATFTAHFQNAPPLVCCNRTASRGEFRGKRLQSLFEQGDYDSLKDLFLSHHNNEHDAILLAMKPLLNAEFLRLIKGWNDQEVQELKTAIASIPIGKINLGALIEDIDRKPEIHR